MSDQAREQAEWVSALMDGALQDAEFVRAIDHLEASVSAREAWDTYHLVGDALRSGQLASPAHDAQFVARLRTKLALDTPRFDAESQNKLALVAVQSKSKQAANEGLWRRVVGLASFAFVGVLIWQAQGWISAERSPAGGAVLVQLPTQRLVAEPLAPVTVAEDETPVMLRDPQLDALLAAHRQHGGVTALQAPAGFLRNATFSEANQ